MKFSIIIPVYNVEKYIGKCIESVLNQTLKDYECLLIDDGTKDDSIIKAQEVFKKDKRFVVYHKENGGLSDARNFGLSKAKGDYVFFLDSDDYISEDLLEKTYEMAIKHNSDITCFDMYYEYEDGRLEVSKGGRFEKTGFKVNKEIIFENHSANNKIYKREFLGDDTFIKGMWYEDLATVPVWMAKANNVSYVEEPLYYYVQRGGSISHSDDPRIFDVYKAIDNVKSELGLGYEDVFDFYYYDCLIMTTLRIRNIKDKNTRIEYYRINAFRLNKDCPNWYNLAKKKKPTFKQKIIFNLIRNEAAILLNTIY